MQLRELRKHWHEFGNTDPLWAILSDESKHGGKWDREDFFRSGEREIEKVARLVEWLGVIPPRRRALDFGCGVGRLTQALCRYFDECCGVDIAPSMIRLARRYNRHGRRCRYVMNESDDLRAFEDGSFDFVYSFLVLQHMRPDFAKRYIREFLRVLAPRGMLVFQIPSEPIGPGGAAQSRVAQPLSATGFQAQITVDETSLAVKPLSFVTLRTRVQNRSSVTWRALPASVVDRQIRLGSRWLSSDGRRLLEDGARVNIGRDLAPMEEVEVHITVLTPESPGCFVLELDVIQEGVAWFADEGSKSVRLAVTVLGREKRSLSRFYGRLIRRTPADRSGVSLDPRMEMYGVPKEEVVDLVLGAGGSVLHVRDYPCAGPDWESYLYVVLKRS